MGLRRVAEDYVVGGSANKLTDDPLSILYGFKCLTLAIKTKMAATLAAIFVFLA
jgi:hypothetical protein